MNHRSNEKLIEYIKMEIENIMEEKEYLERMEFYRWEFVEHEVKSKEDFVNLRIIDYILDQFGLSSAERFEKLLKVLELKYRVYIVNYAHKNFKDLPKREREWLIMKLSKDTSYKVRKETMNIFKRHFASISRTVREDLIALFLRDKRGDIREDVISTIYREYDEISKDLRENVLTEHIVDEEPSIRVLIVGTILKNYKTLPKQVTGLVEETDLREILIQGREMVDRSKYGWLEMETPMMVERFPTRELEREFYSMKEAKNRISSVRKFADITFPSCIRLNERYPLVVRLLREEFDEATNSMILLFGYIEGIDEIEILVTLDARDFEIEKTEQKMIVPLTRNSEPVVFYLSPKSIGKKTIRLKFYQNEKYNGEIIVDTTVIRPTNGKKVERASFRGEVAARLARKADEDVRIEVETTDSHLEYKVTSRALGLFRKKFHTEVQIHEPRRFMSAMLRELGMISSASYSEKEKYVNTISKVETIGMNLYKRLIPDQLKQILWDNKEGIQSIFIVTDEEWIPWEIIKPFRISGDGNIEVDDFWCMDHVISRWLSPHFPWERIPVRKSIVIAYDNRGKLAYVPKEKENIEKILKSKDVEILSTEPKRLEILELLSNKEINLFHFACECFYDESSPDNSYMKLSDYELKARDISVSNLRKGRPFVFINACESGRAGYTYSGLGGFAEAFLDVGALAFMGPMWKIPDRLSMMFSEEFYKNIIENKLSLGEALRKTRHALRELDNPAWLSYALYSFPLAEIVV
ncbi:MAG: CHAT domain-containing protein [Theionarchaea archaeon]|nr:CHAT domain-containing protein [Theionarchaea archaeon]